LRLQGYSDKFLAITASQLPELDPSSYPDVEAKGFWDWITSLGSKIRKELDRFFSRVGKEASKTLRQILRIIKEHIGEVFVAILSSQLVDGEKTEAAENGAKNFRTAARSSANTSDKLNAALRSWVNTSSSTARPVVVGAVHSSFVRHVR
jgi:hypothetical protein